MRNVIVLALVACHKLPPAPAEAPDAVPPIAWSRHADEAIVTNTGEARVEVYAIEILGTVAGVPGAVSRGRGGPIEPGGTLRSPVAWLTDANQALVRTDHGVLVVDLADDPPHPPDRPDGDPLRGQLAAHEIDAVFAANKEPFFRCFRQSLSVTRDLTGTVVLRFVIAPTGSVAFARVKSTTFSAGDVEVCAVRALELLSFPPSPDGTALAVAYPFSF